MNESKVASIISLCSRAGKLKTGEGACEEALRNNEAKLVLISKDASENTKKKFKNKAFYYKVELLEYGLKDELGKMTGKKLSSSLVITDEGFASMLIDIFKC